MRRITAITLAILSAGLIFAGTNPASAGGGCHSDVFSDEANTRVDLTKNCFAPTVTRVQPGDTVTFTNSDPDAHAVTGAANSWGMTGDVGKVGDQIDPGESVSYQFDRSGVFPYYCAFHPSMVGAVVVGDGSAASASEARDSVNVVSEELPGGQAAGDGSAGVVDEDSGGGSTVPLLTGAGVLVAITGFARAFVLRRRQARTGDA